jgi:hypothetical protein
MVETTEPTQRPPMAQVNPSRMPCFKHNSNIQRSAPRSHLTERLEVKFFGPTRQQKTHAPPQRNLAAQRNLVSTIFRNALGVLPDSQI